GPGSDTLRPGSATREVTGGTVPGLKRRAWNGSNGGPAVGRDRTIAISVAALRSGRTTGGGAGTGTGAGTGGEAGGGARGAAGGGAARRAAARASAPHGRRGPGCPCRSQP